jgi:hypothetical protein
MIYTKMEKIVDYASGRADPETAEEVRRDLADPDSPTTRLTRELAESADAPFGWRLPPLDPRACPEVFEALEDLASTANQPRGRTLADEDPERAGYVDEDMPAVPASPSAELPSVIPLTHRDSRSAKHPWLERTGPARWTAYAIAASLLIGLGVLIGSRIFQGGGAAGGMEILVASVTPQFLPAKGTEMDLRVEIQSGRPGFASVISLAPDRRQQVFPLPGAGAVPVGPAGTGPYGPLPPDSRTVLVVVTDRPATDAIRDALLGKPFTPSQAGQLQGYLREVLAAAGHRWAAFGITRFERSPKE